MSDKKVDAVISELNKHYGKTLITVASAHRRCERIRWGVPMVDYVAGGGIPINKVVELWGPESSGKSYLAYKAIAEFQHFDWGSRKQKAFAGFEYKAKKMRGSEKLGLDDYEIMLEVKKIMNPKVKVRADEALSKRCVLIDYENTYDPEWGEHLGVNNDGLIHVVPESGSEAIDVTEAFLRNADISLVVIDSVGVISSDLEVDASMESEQMGVNARFWNKAMRKFQTAMNANPHKDVTLILINRAYAAIGRMYGDPEEVGGGKGIRFAKAVSIRLTPLKEIKEADVCIGRNIKVKCTKNKTARPYLEGTMYFSFIDTEHVGAGELDTFNQIVDLGLDHEVITRKGAYYSYGTVTEQGRESFIDVIRDEKLEDKITADVFKKVFNNG